MKTRKFLVFCKNGEILQDSIQISKFDINLFPKFKHYKRYNDYIILYNVEEGKNLTVFYFTEDRYMSDVALLRVNTNDEVKNLTYNMYAKQIKIKYEPNEYSSDTDEEIEDITPFTFT